MSDNDLFRNGAEPLGSEGVKIHPQDILNAAWRDDLGEEGLAMYDRILAALEPVTAPDPVHRPTMTDMMVDPDMLDAFMEANPLPPDPDPAKQVSISEAEAIREAALREALKALEDSDNARCASCGHPRNNHPHRHPFISLMHVDPKDAILALIQKGDTNV